MIHGSQCDRIARYLRQGRSLTPLEGLRFHHITVGERAPSIRGRSAHWYTCDCGNVKSAIVTYLRKQRPKSCGCKSRELIATGHRTHGMTDTPTFAAWRSMKKRCELKSRKDWPRYGGRGIGYCERWKEFENFLRDMGVAPPRMQLDRIDNDGNYSPRNCRWVTPQQNSNNRSNNRFITAMGITQTVAQWAREIGLPYATIAKRLEAGWTEENSITRPLRFLRRRDTHASAA